MPNGRYRKYIEHVRADLAMEPSWPPSADRRLGDVGVFRQGHFERKGTLETLFGLAVKPRPVKNRTTVYHGDSKGTVRVHHNSAIGAGAALVTADSSLVLEFDKADSVLFHATGCRTEEIDRIEAVEQLMKELHGKGEWPRKQVVITEVTHARRTTAVMCSKRNDRMSLRAAADPTVTGLDLLTASGGLQWTGGSAASLQVLSEGRLTPLYRARGMIRHLFRADEVGFLDDVEDVEGDDAEWYVDDVSSLDFDTLP
ncbi:hypothetical protein STRCI_006499 [Streptomyces cinnabarinus]|uniref:Uncharacterized protein n=1 Tax=Streptomyces cinnabarinus TaxID=67287 RepID=A0ABY7KKG7_9ACTN|nr:hypothetical protein [Streptomyces cinnabarinus]WAZ25036.1 hypothetical protein STRCI_006499 [Streptomyces cinnabarinus]